MKNSNTLDFEKIISTELIEIDLSVSTKQELFEVLAGKLYSADKITDTEVYIKDVYEREEMGYTGIGEGIAIPHARSTSVKHNSIVIASLKEAIDWQSVDKKPVSFIIMFAIKDTDKSTTHIQMLQHISLLLAEDDFIEGLSTIKTKQEMFDYFVNNDIIDK